MEKRIIALLMFFVFICGSATQAGERGRHAFMFRNVGNPYGEKEMDGFKVAIEEQGAEAILRAPDLPTAEAQIQIIEELIAQQVTSISVVAADPDALVPVLRKAMRRGIKVLSADSGVNSSARHVHINQADPERIGRMLAQGAYEMAGGSGDIAVISANAQSTNQNTWISWIRKEMELPKYKNLKLVKIAYGDDLNDKATSETEGLLKSFPNLKVIIAPTTVGVAAAGKVLSDKNLQGKTLLIGLGLPSEMAEYISNGACPYMYLWNPIDVGYLTGRAALALSDGTIDGSVGGQFNAGRLGGKEVIPDGNGTQIMLGDPFRFDKTNIDEWKVIY